MTKPKIFIDGEAGTTGLEISKRLESKSGLEVIRIAEDKRKSIDERRKLLNECDLAVLCLPDEAAIEAVSLITNPKVRVLDASTAHRVHKDWVYGFPEMHKDQTDKIRKAKRVSNPGCYPTGIVGILRPLIDKKIIPPSYGLTITAVSGYSGGGRAMIDICEEEAKTGNRTEKSAGYCLYGINQHHKHLPEIIKHSCLKKEPIFLPAYSGAFYKGMLITIAVRLDEINTGVEEIHEALSEHYKGQRFVKVEELRKISNGHIVTPVTQNDTNNMVLRVFGSYNKKTAVLTTCLDNLGKGASGAAVQNAEIMLGEL
ncbi:MAG: N-acetyl-gamma-glutamyl-phosphate reductase [Alphaproteobacteria bacterium]|nr:N-acetyl-gamma-glutamyl-phosphate reductase [Alphaproteobacteria bacterium]MCL2504664.1 N-acetyl-gamma-glutamyl-phosphate reductase [Alphaproteobacteria bacterium]